MHSLSRTYFTKKPPTRWTCLFHVPGVLASAISVLNVLREVPLIDLGPFLTVLVNQFDWLVEILVFFPLDWPIFDAFEITRTKQRLITAFVLVAFQPILQLKHTSKRGFFRRQLSQIGWGFTLAITTLSLTLAAALVHERIVIVLGLLAIGASLLSPVLIILDQRQKRPTETPLVLTRREEFAPELDPMRSRNHLFLIGAYVTTAAALLGLSLAFGW